MKNLTLEEIGKLAEVAIPRTLFRDILRRIERLKPGPVSLDSG
jgi:hypothetical protein